MPSAVTAARGRFLVVDDCTRMSRPQRAPSARAIDPGPDYRRPGRDNPSATPEIRRCAQSATASAPITYPRPRLTACELAAGNRHPDRPLRTAELDGERPTVNAGDDETTDRQWSRRRARAAGRAPPDRPRARRAGRAPGRSRRPRSPRSHPAAFRAPSRIGPATGQHRTAPLTRRER